MPELPEVETIAADVRPHLEGRRIVRARVARPDVLRSIRRKAFERGLKGRLIARVARRAKHLVIVLDDGYRLVIQPRMTGGMVIPGRGASSSRDPYVCLTLDLDDGTRVAYRDVRRLGAVFLLAPAAWGRYDAAIGPEPLDPAFTPQRLGGILSRAGLAAKKAIMDQRRLAGVGNIYASEALWLAGIDPSRPARRLTGPEVARLHGAIVDVLRRSIANRGTTVRDYRTGRGEPGRFQNRLAVYARAGEPCPRCATRIALTHALDGRATYFCHRCQR